MRSTMRPDEESLEAEKERAQNLNSSLKKGAKTALTLGTTAVGAGLSSKIMPFLSPYIGADLAVKGLSKVSPKVGDFLKNGMEQGLTLQSGLNFLKDSIGQNQKSNPKQDQRNIIEQYSPELHEFLMNQIQEGKTPEQAGALAQTNANFKNSIKNIERDHKTNWSSILQNIYGGQQNDPSKAALHAETSEVPEQGGPGNQALASILQQIQQIRGG